MIPIDKKITELTWGEIVADLDERYGKGTVVPMKQPYLNPATEGYINVKQCAALTDYSEGYIGNSADTIPPIPPEARPVIPQHRSPPIPR